jgi:chloramphenicol O-acetyltransferase type A
MKVFDIENWNRKTQYEFFKNYEDPFFNITANLEVSELYKYCKHHELSFSLACIYIALKAMNEMTAFKLRIKNGKVYVFNEVHIGSTILNDDNTFSFCYFQNQSSIFEFDQQGKNIIANHKKKSKFEPNEGAIEVVHCTTLPWISFTGFKHARNGDEASKGIPKIVFGKLFDSDEAKKIPFSVEVHHALMDGYHVSLLFKTMQQFIDELQ